MHNTFVFLQFFLFFFCWRFTYTLLNTSRQTSETNAPHILNEKILKNEQIVKTWFCVPFYFNLALDDVLGFFPPPLRSFFYLFRFAIFFCTCMCFTFFFFSFVVVVFPVFFLLFRLNLLLGINFFVLLQLMLISPFLQLHAQETSKKCSLWLRISYNGWELVRSQMQMCWDDCGKHWKYCAVCLCEHSIHSSYNSRLAKNYELQVEWF